MLKPTNLLSFSTALVLSAATSFATGSKPFVTIDIQNYDALLADAGAIAVATGQDASTVELEVQGMLGEELTGLIDPTKPWHAAVWMESLEQSPVIAVDLPDAWQPLLDSGMQSLMPIYGLDDEAAHEWVEMTRLLKSMRTHAYSGSWILLRFFN